MNCLKVAFIVIALLIAGLIQGCSVAPAQTGSGEAVRVRISEVVDAELAQPIRTSGKLASKAELKLSFKVGGIVRQMYVDEGQEVKKGQALAQLDLREIEAQVNQARSVHEKALRDQERIRKLYEDNAVTLENYQDALTGLDIARSNLNVAEFNLRYATITAPAKGHILRRFVEKDELVAPGTPIFLFGSSERDWIVRVGVTDREIVRLAIDDPAILTFDAWPENEFSARVTEIAETDDPRTGLYEIELGLIPVEHKLISGFVARVLITPQHKDRYQVIPIEALVEGNRNSGFVYVIDESGTIARKRGIKISHIFDHQVAVISGLESGMSVITAGVQYLVDGNQVEVMTGESTPRADSPPTAPIQTDEKQAAERP